jgi:hypothetical protein
MKAIHRTPSPGGGSPPATSGAAMRMFLIEGVYFFFMGDFFVPGRLSITKKSLPTVY